VRSEWRQWSSETRIPLRVTGGRAFAVYPLLGGDVVEHDDGTWSPIAFTYVEFPDDARLPYFIVECEYSRDDLVPRVMALHVVQRDPAREVLASDLRSVNLHQAIEDAWIAVSRRPGVVQSGEVDVAESFSDDGPETKRTLKGLRQRARRRITDHLLEEVAGVYRRHLDSGAPTKAVKEHFGIAESTASDYVRRARDAGKDMTDSPSDGDREA
jgi:hypothetical protein